MVGEDCVKMRKTFFFFLFKLIDYSSTVWILGIAGRAKQKLQTSDHKNKIKKEQSWERKKKKKEVKNWIK